MSVPIKALAIDLDGKLLRADEQISPRNRAALATARAAGIEVIVATARWFQLAEDAVAQLEIDGGPMRGPAIACSGAEVRRLADGTDLFDLRLPLPFAADLYELCDRERCIVWAALDEEVLMKMDGPQVGVLPHGLRQVAALADSAVAPRMILVQGRDIVSRIEDELAPSWADRVRFVESFSSQGKRILTLTSTGADKGVALRAACADLGIDPSEVVAFGDAENDIDMFEVAGASVAMGQANDAVKRAATSVTLSNAEDGVAVAVERLLAGGDARSPEFFD